MGLPPSLLSLAEAHACFSGVWGISASAEGVVDARGPTRNLAVLQCKDCLDHHLAVDLRLVPGVTPRQLGSDLTTHVRRHRGYTHSVSGYFTAGGGFWLSAAYWGGAGVFVLRTRQSADPISSLVKAVQCGVFPQLHPRLADASEYVTEQVHLRLSPPPKAPSMAALLAAPQVSRTPRSGYVPVTLAAFRPVAAAAGASALPGYLASPPLVAATASCSPSPPSPGVAGPRRPPTPPTPRRPLALGELCPVCGTRVRERPLLTSTFLGCDCE